MARKPVLPEDAFGSIKLTHHVLSRERMAALRRRPGPRSSRPECVIIGHAWSDDPNGGGSMCIICQVVRRP